MEYKMKDKIITLLRACFLASTFSFPMRFCGY